MSTSSVFLLGRKKNVECAEKISSVFMLVVLIDEENLLDKTLLQSFVGGLVSFVVVRTSSGRDSLYAFSAGTTGIHTKTICSETN